MDTEKQDDKGVHFFTHFSELFVPVLRGDREQWVFGCFFYVELDIARRETCDRLQERCDDRCNVNFIPLEMDRLYLFTNARLDDDYEGTEKNTVVNVLRRFNVLGTAVDAYHVPSGLFTKDDPVK